VEDVRPVRVDEDALVVVAVVGVAADVRPFLDHQHALPEPARQPLGQHAAGEAGADDQVIEPAPAGDRCRHRALETLTAFVHEDSLVAAARKEAAAVPLCSKRQAVSPQ
jgi:hypothetical protein